MLGARDTGATDLQQFTGPLDPRREEVDIELVAFELVEDRLQLGHGLPVPGL